MYFIILCTICIACSYTWFANDWSYNLSIKNIFCIRMLHAQFLVKVYSTQLVIVHTFDKINRWLYTAYIVIDNNVFSISVITTLSDIFRYLYSDIIFTIAHSFYYHNFHYLLSTWYTQAIQFKPITHFDIRKRYCMLDTND